MSKPVKNFPKTFFWAETELREECKENYMREGESEARMRLQESKQNYVLSLEGNYASSEGALT